MQIQKILTFQSDFWNGEDWDFLVVFADWHAALHFQALDVVLLQVQLEHVQSGTLDVL